MSIVGTSTKTADGIKERVRAAILNSGLEFPRKRITINLAPAGEALDGSLYDLPIALAILTRSGQIKAESLDKYWVVGELGLDGTTRPVRGILGMAMSMRDDHKSLLAPIENSSQLSLVANCSHFLVESLRDAYEFLNGVPPTKQYRRPHNPPLQQPPEVDFSDIIGQQQAKRALEIAAAGHHNVLMTGPPGTGKSMLAKALVGILPPLEIDEQIVISQIHSLIAASFEKRIETRPFRSPHHSASHISLVGGGQNPRPGEISLSHGGVLFMDEIPEFSKQALESLRQPMEDRTIHVSRASRSVSFPSDFILVATMNPCPCGFYGDPVKTCSCTSQEILKYQKKLSGPILDRIDLHIRVERLPSNFLMPTNPNKSDTSAAIQSRIEKARVLQKVRFGERHQTNASMTSAYIRKNSMLDQEVINLLDQASDRLQLSTRGYFRTIRVARTIADIEGAEKISLTHMTEALQYRILPSFSTVSA